MKRRPAALAAVLLLAPALVSTQAPSSQHAALTQVLGTTQVTIVYNRQMPGGGALRKGRSRAVGQGVVSGADTATTIALSRDMPSAGNRSQPGNTASGRFPAPTNGR